MFNKTNGGEATYVYAQMTDSLGLEQAFTFHAASSQGQFAGSEFDIGAGSVKWSINVTSQTPSAGLTVRYRLNGLVADLASTPISVRRSSHMPRANMTTYFLSFSAPSVDPKKVTAVGCVLELFDVVLVDGDRVALIEHEVTASDSDFVLELRFPAFDHSMWYDPSIGLGVLLGSSSRDGASVGGDGDTGLIVGVAVAVGVAVLVVVAVAVVGTLLIWRKKHRASARLRRSTNLARTL
jgi:hypothetical protein